MPEKEEQNPLKDVTAFDIVRLNSEKIAELEKKMDSLAGCIDDLTELYEITKKKVEYIIEVSK